MVECGPKAMFLKPDFPALAGISAVFGAVVAALAVPGVAKPAAAARLWRAFPRSVWPGRVMAAVALVWTAAWAPLFIVEFVPSAAPRLFPLLQFVLAGMVVATCVALPDLLSCRAAGMLMLLVPTPILSAAQWHPSPFRYLAIAVSYAMVVAGMFATARPWLLRDAVLRANSTESRTRAVSAAFLVLAAAFLACAVFAFPVAPGTPPLR